MEELRKMDNVDIIHDIKEYKSSEYSIFLIIELKNRFENRLIEEQHLSFEQWKKILILRNDNIEIYNNLNKNNNIKEFELPSKKNKEYFKNKDIEIPDSIKNMSTYKLLSARFKHYNRDAIYAELANRPHIPNKLEKKKIRLKKQKKILKFKNK